MSAFLTRVNEATAKKTPDESPLMRTLRRCVVQAVKCEVPLFHGDNSLFEMMTKVDDDEAKEHHDNIKRVIALLKDVEECLEKARKTVEQQHQGAVLQKGKNYL